jgi:hypothetical protein
VDGWLPDLVELSLASLTATELVLAINAANEYLSILIFVTKTGNRLFK